MGRRRFPVVKGSCHEDEGERSKDRDDIIEAGKKLKAAKAREAREATDSAGGESGVGVKAMKKAWSNVYPKDGAIRKGQK